MLKIPLLDSKQLKESDQFPLILMFFQNVVPNKYMISHFFSFLGLQVPIWTCLCLDHGGYIKEGKKKGGFKKMWYNLPTISL